MKATLTIMLAASALIFGASAASTMPGAAALGVHVVTPCGKFCPPQKQTPSVPIVDSKSR